MSKKRVVDARAMLLSLAGDLLKGGPVKIYGKTFVGEEAINKGFDVVSLIQSMDRRYKDK